MHRTAIYSWVTQYVNKLIVAQNGIPISFSEYLKEKTIVKYINYTS